MLVGIIHVMGTSEGTYHGEKKSPRKVFRNRLAASALVRLS